MKMSLQTRSERSVVKQAQRGGFAMGMVAGMLIGLALALGVALFITKAPVPFVNKVPQRTADQDTAETERNRTWDTNAPMSGKGAAGRHGAPVPGGAAVVAGTPPATVYPDAVPGQPPLPLPAPVTVTGQTPTATGKPTTTNPTTATTSASARDPAAILSGAATPGAQPTATTGNSTANPNAQGPDPFIYFVQAGAFARSEDAEQQRAKLGLLGQQAKITEREQSGRLMYRVRMGPYPRRDEADGLQARLQEQSIESQIVRVEKP
jgi:cell division protein FtsN